MSFRSLFGKVKDLVQGEKTLSWTNKCTLAKEFPDDNIVSLSDISGIEVGDDELAACYSSNSFTNLLRPGIHDKPEMTDKIVFLDTGVQREKFGIRAPNHPITIDKKSFGCSGYVYFKIIGENTAVGNFVNKIYSKTASCSSKEVMRWLRDGVLSTAFQDIVKDETCESFFNKENNDIVLDFETKIGYELMDYGLELVSLDIQNFSNPRKF